MASRYSSRRAVWFWSVHQPECRVVRGLRDAHLGDGRDGRNQVAGQRSQMREMCHGGDHAELGILRMSVADNCM